MLAEKKEEKDAARRYEGRRSKGMRCNAHGQVSTMEDHEVRLE